MGHFRTQYANPAREVVAVTRTPVVVLAAASLAACGGGGRGGEPAAAVTVRVEVGDAARTDAVAKVVGGRLRSLGATPVSSVTEPGVATFTVPRRLTGDEEDALTATGDLVFRPVVETREPGPDCATPSPRRADVAATLTACDHGGDATYVLGPAEDVEVASARAEDGLSAEGMSTGEWIVVVTLADAAAWQAVTAKHVEKQLAIVLDGIVQSAPTVQEPIPNGGVHIAGSFTEAEARRIAAVLSSGVLPAPVTVTQTG